MAVPKNPLGGPEPAPRIPRKPTVSRKTIAASIDHLFASRAHLVALVAWLIALQLLPAFAWVFPEHRDIVVLAVQKLDPEKRTQLEKLWQEARSGHESRLCENIANPAQSPKPNCIDYAAWAAISGDHSCSARDMLNTVLNAPWIIGVAGVSGKLKVQLAHAKRRDQRVNAIKDSNIALERTDPDYATRATSNDAHFLLARPNVSIQPLEYARLALGPRADLNALATYLWYHLRAITGAERLQGGDLSGDARAQAARAALADEAFAIHFIEDSFAAGHVAGNWGNSAIRLGTHDYYNEHGIPLTTWDGHPFVALGDANMRAEDADRAASAVKDSLAQLVDALDGKVKLAGVEVPQQIEPETFDVCKAERFSVMAGTGEDMRLTTAIIEQTPVPALGAGLGELPRFRAELGPFVGLSTAVRGGALTRGFGTTQTDASSIGGIEAAFRFGIGLEGVLNESSDGLAFAEIGIREDRHASGLATLPGRGALTARLRMPFWLIPGDLLIAGPVLAFASPRSLMKMAVGAANGGLIPWQAGIARRFGRFQFVLGREAGMSFYRNNSDHPVLIPTPGVPPAGATLVTLRSFQIEFPILEYRLFRTFSLNQSSGLIVQPYVGFDTPTSSSVYSPTGAPKPDLHTITTAGVRLVFDWRHYLNLKK